MLDLIKMVVRFPIEPLLLISTPFRYSVVVVVLVLFFLYAVPPGGIRHILGIILTGVAWLLKGVIIVLEKISELLPRRLSFINNVLEFPIEILRWLGYIIEGGSNDTVQKNQGIISRLRRVRWWWGSPLNWKAFVVILVITMIVPMALWLITDDTALGDTQLGGFIKGIYAGWHHIEDWVLEDTPTVTPVLTVTPKSPTAEPSSTPEPPEEYAVHEVQRGEELRYIARRYGVDISCIIKRNRQIHPNFNPDSLIIGMELEIPVGDPRCR